MGYSRIKGTLRSRINAPVRYSPPRDVARFGGGHRTGKIVDEVWADPDINTLPPRKRTNKDDWGDYSFCSQLIQWDDGSFSIRLAYYRRRAGEDFWEYASQTTVDSDWKTITALFKKTLAKTHWFNDKP
jgi:hypothetical protein